MGKVLQQTARLAVELELRGIVLTGDISRIWGYFRRVTMLPPVEEIPK